MRCKLISRYGLWYKCGLGAPHLASPALQGCSPWGLWYFLSSLNSLCSPVPGRARSLVAVPRPSSSSSLERAGRGPSLQDRTHTGTRQRRCAWGPAPCRPSGFSLGLRQLYGQGSSVPKDPYWSPVCLLSAVGLSANPRVATMSSSSSNSTSSFFRTGVSPGVSGIDGPRGQNTGHSAHGPPCPQPWCLKGGASLRPGPLGVAAGIPCVWSAHRTDAPAPPQAHASHLPVQRH